MFQKREKGISLLLAGLLVLSACSAPAVESPTPTPEPTPTATETPAAVPTPTPEPTPSPTPEPTPTPTPPPPTVAMERPDLTGEWHRTNCQGSYAATLNIYQQTGEGFLVDAECWYFSHLGTWWEESARFIGENAAVVEEYGYGFEPGEEKPPVKFIWEGDTLTVETSAVDYQLGFGVGVGIRGTYTRGEPEYTNIRTLDQYLTAEQQKILEELGEDAKNSIRVGIEDGVPVTPTPCILLDGRQGVSLETFYPTLSFYNWTLIFTEDGKVYGQNNPNFYTNDPSATEMPEILWPREDDTHDFFCVPTGGKLGTVLVTVEMVEGDYEFMRPATLSVWDSNDLSTPIQVMEEEGFTHYYELLDANFDGYMDFCYTWFLAATNKNDSLWLWDEEAGEFIYGESLLGHGLVINKEAELVCSYTHGSAVSGTESIFRWENGELILIRRIETHYPDFLEDGSVQQLLTVEDNMNGELTEVYRGMFGDPDNGEIYREALLWYDVEYHGE